MSGFFVNDKYRVLECMANRQISVNNEQIVKLSQQEIADILHFTKTKVNTIIGELKTNGYIVQLSSRENIHSQVKQIPNLEKWVTRRVRNEYKYNAIRSRNPCAHRP